MMRFSSSALRSSSSRFSRSSSCLYFSSSSLRSLSFAATIITSIKLACSPSFLSNPSLTFLISLSICSYVLLCSIRSFISSSRCLSSASLNKFSLMS